MSFRVNEKVKFLKQTGHGIVIEVLSQKKFLVEDELGFTQIYDSLSLVKIHESKNKIKTEIDQIIAEKEFVPKHKIKKKEPKIISTPEIDLHIEQLMESNIGMSNAEILRVQMRHFKHFFQTSRAKKTQKIIIIHGVGEGVLKEEIRLYLKNIENISYYDADYLKYGKGATEIIFF